MYDILIDYRMADSLREEEVGDESLGIVVSTLEMAEENLRRIQEHDEEGSEEDLTLQTDDGDRTISPFWVGYFERFRSARIVFEEDPCTKKQN